jgi:hypothetical protein
MSPSGPSRRFLQFQLSTWFVLIAIVAWAMSLGPHVQWSDRALRAEYSGEIIVAIYIVPEHGAGLTQRWLYFGPSKLMWPALAFFAFLGLKALAPIIERAGSRPFFKHLAAMAARTDQTPKPWTNEVGSENAWSVRSVLDRMLLIIATVVLAIALGALLLPSVH